MEEATRTWSKAMKSSASFFIGFMFAVVTASYWHTAPAPLVDEFGEECIPLSRINLELCIPDLTYWEATAPQRELALAIRSAQWEHHGHIVACDIAGCDIRSAIGPSQPDDEWVCASKHETIFNKGRPWQSGTLETDR